MKITGKATILAMAVTILAMAVTILALIIGTGGAALAGPKSPDGFLGKPWGAKVSDFPQARYSVDLSGGYSVYVTPADLTPLLGSVQALSGPRLIFGQKGLEKVYILFPGRDYQAVETHLNQVLGHQAPIVYELMNGKPFFGESALWHIGKQTRIILTQKVSGAAMEITSRDSAAPGGSQFEQALFTALLHQAEGHEQNHRQGEASSVYQELLNSTESYQFFTLQAQERLIAFSRSDETSEELAIVDGRTFRGLNSHFSDQGGQLWLRVDLEATSPINAALCRVQAGPGYHIQVIEQVWLNSANEIIGSKQPWQERQDETSLYIEKVCQQFLLKWLLSPAVIHSR